jgi:hypothetical protein
VVVVGWGILGIRVGGNRSAGPSSRSSLSLSPPARTPCGTTGLIRGMADFCDDLWPWQCMLAWFGIILVAYMFAMLLYCKYCTNKCNKQNVTVSSTWEAVESPPRTGTEIRNDTLAEALDQMVAFALPEEEEVENRYEFTQSEWDAMGVTASGGGPHWIRVERGRGVRYFKTVRTNAAAPAVGNSRDGARGRGAIPIELPGIGV